jgi:integrase
MPASSPYFRETKVRIRGVPGSEEFMAAYQTALAGKPKTLPRIAVRGSFRHLCQLYFASLDFRQLDVATQSWRRKTLEAISQQYGDQPVAQLEGRHVRRIVEERADKPSAAKKRLRAMQALFKWALANNEVARNPTRDVAPVRYLEKGHHTWTLDEVEAFEVRHPLGTKARLAMALMLYTACRREDVVRLGPQNVRGDRIRFVQAKNEHRNPVTVDIPVHPDLAAAIGAAPSGHLNFVVTHLGRPFTPLVSGTGSEIAVTRPGSSIVRHTGCARRRRLGLQNAVRRHTRSWPSPGIVRLRRSNGTPGRPLVRALPTRAWRSSNGERRLSHSRLRWDKSVENISAIKWR